MGSSCPDCGATPTNHFITHTTVVVDWVMMPYERLVDRVLRFFTKRMKQWTGDASVARFLDLLALFRVVSWQQDPEINDSWRTKCVWEAADARWVSLRKMRLFGYPTEFFVAQLRGRTLVFDVLPRPFGANTSTQQAMDDKGAMLELFTRAGIPVAPGGVAWRESTAREIFKRITPPVVVKPNFGSRSRHTTIHINTETDLIRAYRVAKQLSPWVVIEEELVGPVYRATVIDGQVAAVMRRDPACVVGDGSHTVLQLIAAANKNPKRNGPIFHEMAIDDEAKTELAHQRLTPESVPGKNVRVLLGQKVGRGSGGTTADVTDNVHPDNIELFKKVGVTIRDSVVGLDCIFSDIRKSWKDQERCGIIECNSMPFVDLHHFPFEGQARDVAGMLWDSVIRSMSKSDKN